MVLVTWTWRTFSGETIEITITNYYCMTTNVSLQQVCRVIFYSIAEQLNKNINITLQIL